MHPEWHFLFDDVLGEVELAAELVWAYALIFVLYFGVIETIYQDRMDWHTFKVEVTVIESKCQINMP